MDFENLYFLAFAGALLGLIVVVILYEKYFGDDLILDTKPRVVVFNIAVSQIVFYVQYLLITFSVNLIVQEPFWISQLFDASEFSFYTTRGLSTFFSLVIAFISLSLPLTATVRHSQTMSDYTFTAFTFHFIIVSCVMGHFPTTGAWWVACLLGSLLGILGAEFGTHQLEMMTYASALGKRRSIKKSPQANGKEKEKEKEKEKGKGREMEETQNSEVLRSDKSEKSIYESSNDLIKRKCSATSVDNNSSNNNNNNNK